MVYLGENSRLVCNWMDPDKSLGHSNDQTDMAVALQMKHIVYLFDINATLPVLIDVLF